MKRSILFLLVIVFPLVACAGSSGNLYVIVPPGYPGAVSSKNIKECDVKATLSTIPYSGANNKLLSYCNAKMIYASNQEVKWRTTLSLVPSLAPLCSIVIDTTCKQDWGTLTIEGCSMVRDMSHCAALKVDSFQAYPPGPDGAENNILVVFTPNN